MLELEPLSKRLYLYTLPLPLSPLPASRGTCPRLRRGQLQPGGQKQAEGQSTMKCGKALQPCRTPGQIRRWPLACCPAPHSCRPVVYVCKSDCDLSGLRSGLTCLPHASFARPAELMQIRVLRYLQGNSSHFGTSLLISHQHWVALRLDVPEHKPRKIQLGSLQLGKTRSKMTMPVQAGCMFSNSAVSCTPGVNRIELCFMAGVAAILRTVSVGSDGGKRWEPFTALKLLRLPEGFNNLLQRQCFEGQVVHLAPHFGALHESSPSGKGFCGPSLAM